MIIAAMNPFRVERFDVPASPRPTTINLLPDSRHPERMFRGARVPQRRRTVKQIDAKAKICLIGGCSDDRGDLYAGGMRPHALI